MKIFIVIITCMFVMQLQGQTDFCASSEVENAIRTKDSLMYDGWKRNFWQSVNQFRNEHPDGSHLENPYEPVPCENCLVAGANCPKARFVIPVVIHVVYNNSTNNISSSQITHQIEELNKHYSNKYGAATPAVNTGVQFVLANKDINGTTITGITRHSSSLANHKKISESPTLMQLGITNLPMSHYLHIWIVADILDAQGNSTGIKAYSTQPGSYFNGSEGVVIRYDWFGDYNLFGSPLDVDTRANALTHEIGHFLGLLHPFDGGCKGLMSSDCSKEGDKCCDVPAVSGQNSSCSYSNSCTETYNGNPADQKQNYMDYSLPSCKNTFTRNQTEIMHTTLLNYRQALWQPVHINRMTNNNCLLSATFSQKTNFMCKAGSPVIDSFLAYYISGADYQWKAWRRVNNAIVLYKTQNSGFIFTLSNTDTGNYTVQLKVYYNNDSIVRKDSNTLRIQDCGTKVSSYRGNWEFGSFAGLGFYSNNSVYRDLGPFNNRPNIDVEESSITMNDSMGNLVFYGSTRLTDPQIFDVFGHNYRALPGSPIKGYGDGLQQAVAFPAPGITNSYFIVHSVGLRSYNSGSVQSGYNYSIVKINPSNHSLDSVTYFKNKDIRDSLSKFIGGGEAVTAIRHCNGRDYWVLCKGENDTIYRLLATINRQLLYRGYFISGEGYTQCQINPSPDGKLISIGRRLYKFNRGTGAVSFVFLDSAMLAAAPYGPWGSVFSNNGRVLYRSYMNYYNGGHRPELYQYDLESSAPNKSRKKLLDDFDLRNMQTGPDGKVYMSLTGMPYLSVINLADNLVTGSNNACDYQFKGPVLSEKGIGGVSGIDLPNFANTSFATTIKPNFIATIKNCTTVELLSNQTCTQAHRWFFGNGDSSHVESPTYTYSQKGTYAIKLIIGKDTVTRILNFEVPKNTFKIFGDSLSCDSNQMYEYKSQLGLDMSYSWSCTNCKNSIDYLNTFETRWKGAGKLKLTITDNRTKCILKDSIIVTTANPILNNIISNDTLFCKGSSIEINGTQPTGGTGSFSYSWYRSKNGISWDIVKDSSRMHIHTSKPDSFIYYRKVTSNCSQTSNNSKRAKYYFVTNTIVLNKNACLMGKTAKLSGFGIIANGNHFYYTWQYSTDNVNWSNDATYNGYTGTDTSKLNRYNIIVNTRLYIRRKLTTGTCDHYSNVIFIATPNSIRRQPLPSYVCHLGTTTNATYKMNIRMNKYNSALLTFKWEVEDIGGNWISLPTAGGYPIDSTVLGTNNFTLSFPPGSTTYVRCKIVACGDTLVSTIAPLTFTNGVPPTFSKMPTDAYASSGQKGKFIAKSNTGNIQWQKSINNGQTWADIPLETDTFILVEVENYCIDGIGFPQGWLYNKTQYRALLSTGCNTNASIHLFAYHAQKQVIVRDYNHDFGKEPSDTSIKKGRLIPNPMISPDIAISYSQGYNPFTNNDTGLMVVRDPGVENYVWVRIRNRGPQTSLATKMDLHWSMASSGLQWNKNWTVNNSNRFWNPVKGQYYPMGGKINTSPINVPALSPGQTSYIVYKWDTLTTPKAENYYRVVKIRFGPIQFNVIKYFPKNQSICLLARMPECTYLTKGMTFYETSNTSENCRLNNKIAAKVRNLSYLKPPPYTSVMVTDPPVIIRNAQDSIPATIKIGFRANDSLVTNVVEIVATLDSTLEQVWTAGGRQGSGFTLVDSNRVLVTDVVNFKLENIVLDTLQEGAIYFDFYQKLVPTGPGGRDYTFDVWQASNIDTMPEGFAQIILYAPNYIIPGGGEGGGGSGGSEGLRIPNGINPYFGKPGMNFNPKLHDFKFGLIKNEKNPQLLVAYPNPTSSSLTVEWNAESDKPFLLTINNMLGQVVYLIEISPSSDGKYQYTIPLIKQANGVYSVQVSSDGYKAATKVTLIK